MGENDRTQRQRERAYKIWEDEGRPDGAHDDHWARAHQADDLSEQQSDDVTKTNQEADDRFAKNSTAPDSAVDLRPPSSVAPD